MNLLTEGRSTIQCSVLFMMAANAFGATPVADERTVTECHAIAYRIDENKTLGTPIERARRLEKERAKCSGTGAYDVFLAALYQEAGLFDEADRVAQSGLKVTNQYRPNLLHALARSELSRGQVEDAYRMGLDLTRQFPKYAPIYGLLGGIDSKLRHWDKAYEHAKRLVELDPGADSYLSIATTLYQLQRFSEAAAAVNRALELEPQRIGNPAGVIEGIYSLIYLHRREEAADLTKRHMQANPNWRQNAHIVKAAKELELTK